MNSDCCSGVCAADAAGNLVCNPSSCIATGGGCTVDGDCCPGNCCRQNTDGVFQCTTECGVACTGGQLGDFCDTSADCCNSPPVICDTSVEFQTCVIR